MAGVVYCSIFDGSFAARWLVMYRSLVRRSPGARCMALCLDDAARSVVRRLGLPGVEVLTLPQLEAHDRELVATRGTRSAAEYRFTVKPCAYAWLLERTDAEAIVHVDADMMFFAPPDPLERELAGGSVLLVSSAHPPSMPHLDETYGRFQSGLIGFRSDDAGRAAAARWREECLEWCGAEPEPGRWANKRYLNDWPRSLPGVRVSTHPGLGAAAWSVGRYELGERDGQVLLDGQPLVLFHYSGMSFAHGRPALLRPLAFAGGLHYQGGSAPFTWGHLYHRPGARERRLIWAPYAQEVSAALGLTGGALGRPSAQLREVVLRRRVLWGLAWGLRRVLDAGRRRAPLPGAVRLRLGRMVGALDRLRRRWRIE